MKFGGVIVTHVCYNFSKFHQNKMKNKIVLLISRISVQNFKVLVELWKSYIVIRICTAVTSTYNICTLFPYLAPYFIIWICKWNWLLFWFFLSSYLFKNIFCSDKTFSNHQKNSFKKRKSRQWFCKCNSGSNFTSIRPHTHEN